MNTASLLFLCFSFFLASCGVPIENSSENQTELLKTETKKESTKESPPETVSPESIPEASKEKLTEQSLDAGSERLLDSKRTENKEPLNEFQNEQEVSPERPSRPCVKPRVGMILKKDTVFCSGEYKLAPSLGIAVIQIAASNIKVECLGTILRGPKRFKTSDPRYVAFTMRKVKNVEIKGCSAHGYWYGSTAIEASQVTLRDNNFSENFSDPKLEWVFDRVQGGGIRFERMEDSTIENNIVSKNWNGIELRESKNIRVKNNKADRCTNTGGLVLATHHSIIEGNDMSWCLRGGLSFPNRWYGVDTKDSAGLLLDQGSSHNKILKNNLTYGGDGLFLRAVLGACPTHNLIQENDTSFSPHNAIESWCDNNTYIKNKANSSHYGIWLGGSDNTILRDNEVIGNQVDGLSIQIAESRYTLLENNIIKNNGRVGLLATGREYQAWHKLNFWANRLANASQYLIQKNQFGNNKESDIFLTAIRGVLIASNSFQGTPKITIGKDAEGVRILQGSPQDKNQPPQVTLSNQRAVLDQAFTLQLDKAIDPEKSPLSYFWLIQAFQTRFSPTKMPTPTLMGLKSNKVTLTPVDPGIFSVRVIVDDGKLGTLASSKLFVAPEGEDLTEKDTSTWSTFCPGFQCTTNKKIDLQNKVLGDAALQVTTNTPFRFRLTYKPQSTWDLSSYDAISFFIRADNPNGKWQNKYPILRLRDSKGKEIEYRPKEDWLTQADKQWAYIHIPLLGNTAWTRLNKGGELTKVVEVELEVDSWGFQPYTLWIDGFGRRKKRLKPCTATGKKECLNDTLSRECTSGVWKETRCSSEEKCVKDSCQKRMVCVLFGHKECKDANTTRECTNAGQWKDTVCTTEQTCQKGLCLKQGACQLTGHKECININTARTCMKNGTWQEVKCAQEQICLEGACQKGTCTTSNKESCNGKDDDCDGKIDEEIEDLTGCPFKDQSPCRAWCGCERKNAQSCTNTALRYQKGDGITQDVQEAEKLFQKACDLKDPEACFQLGNLYLLNKRDLATARTHFEKACALQSGQACYQLALFYRSGTGVTPDIGKTKDFFTKACKAGEGIGCTKLGLMLQEGKLLTKDLDAARLWFQEACKRKHGDGCMVLGSFYHLGIGVPKNPATAKTWYEKGCAVDSSEACSRLGGLYHSGEGVVKNVVETRRLYLKACTLKNRIGCHNLGLLHLWGQGGPKDFSQARIYFKKACDLGHAAGCHELGLLYSKGEGGSKDCLQALQLYKRACTLGKKDVCSLTCT